MRTTRFGSLAIAYDEAVLEPRPWTLEQARWAIELDGELPPGPVLELCAGVGHIGLVVAAATGRPLVQVDASARACELARRNGVTAGIGADVRAGDIAAAVGPDERFALVLADPPYVPTDDVARHPADPEHAIDGGEDGLALAERCLDVAADHVVPDGAALIQLRDLDQAAALALQRSPLALDLARAVDDRGALALFRPQPDQRSTSSSSRKSTSGAAAVSVPTISPLGSAQ